MEAKGGVEDVGEAEALHEDRDRRRPLDPRIRKRGSLFSLPRPLVFVWAEGGPQKHHLPKAPILQIGPPSRPQLGRCSVSWTGITKAPPPATPFPIRTHKWGLGSECPPRVKGPRNLTHRRQRRPEQKAGAATAAAAGSAWCGLMPAAAPLLWSCYFSPSPQVPNWGGPPFSSSPSPLFLSYPSAKRTRGRG